MQHLTCIDVNNRSTKTVQHVFIILITNNTVFQCINTDSITNTVHNDH